MPDLSPDEIEKLVNGILTAVAAALIWFGTRAGKKAAKEPEGEIMQIAGAIIDGRSAERLSDTFEKAAKAMLSVVEEMGSHRKALDRNTEAAENAREAIKDAGQDIRTMTNALWAGKR